MEACFNAPTLGALYKSATIDAMLKRYGGRGFADNSGGGRMRRAFSLRKGGKQEY